MSDKSDNKVGVIGLGLMGSALADALLDRNRNPVVWNRSPQKCDRYADTAATIADSAASAARESDVLVVCLSDYQASMEVLSSDSVGHYLSGKVIVLLSTMSVDESLSAAQWADTNGIGYLDGSIMGYPDDVRNQACMIVYSGPKALFESCMTELNAMSGLARHLGEKAGMAPQFDKAVYSAYYAHCLGLCHGAAMCEAMGAPLEVYIESFTDQCDWPSHDSRFLDMIKQRDYSSVEATMKVHSAAFSHVLPLSEKLGVNPGLPKVIAESFEMALNQGYEDDELPALFEILGKGRP